MKTTEVTSFPIGVQKSIKRFGPCRIIHVERNISENLFRGMKEKWLLRFDGGAQAILRAEKGEVVLVRQDVPWEECVMWTFPGGGVAKSESFEECVIREAKEEIGLNIKVTGLDGIFQNIGKAPNGESVKWYLVVFEGEILSGQMKVQSPEIQRVATFKKLPHDFWQLKYYQDLVKR